MEGHMKPPPVFSETAPHPAFQHLIDESRKALEQGRYGVIVAALKARQIEFAALTEKIGRGDDKACAATSRAEIMIWHLTAMDAWFDRAIAAIAGDLMEAGNA
jgi:hypothetical protein